MNIYAVTPADERVQEIFDDYSRKAMIFLTTKSLAKQDEHTINTPFRYWIDGNHDTSHEIQVLVDLDDDGEELAHRFCQLMRGRAFNTEENDGFCDMGNRMQPFKVRIE